MRKLSSRKIVLILLPILLFGCSNQFDVLTEPPQSTSEPLPNPTSTSITPNEGLGGIAGVVQDFDPSDYNRDVFVWVADFYGSVEEGGFYVLIPEQFPKTKVEDDGFFQVSNLKPGNYVMVIGMRAESALPVIENGNTKVVEIRADEITDVGNVLTE